MTDQPDPNFANTAAPLNPPTDSPAGAAAVGAAPVEAPRNSLSATISFVSGLLFCLPFGAGILAVLAGIVGLFRTANPMKKGRWMAVTGILLGIVNVTASTILFGAALLAIFMTPTRPAGEVFKEFAVALSTRDIATAQKHAPTMANLPELSDLIRRGGNYQDVTCTMSDVTETTCRATAAVKLDRGSATITVSMRDIKDANHRDDRGWKITQLSVESWASR